MQTTKFTFVPETAQGILCELPQMCARRVVIKYRSVSLRLVRRSGMRLWPVSSSSACANLSRWKCNILLSQARRWKHLKLGERRECNGILTTGCVHRNYVGNEHEKLAHYADAAQDIQYEFPIGWQEVEGIHSRTDFDLGAHQEHSGKKMEYFDQLANEKYIPYVVETSAGLDRTILTLLCEAYREEEVGGDSRTVLKFHPKLAPVTVGILPLVKKDGMPEQAHKMEDMLKEHFNTFYDEKGAIGRRYRRMDEIGTPYCITIDGESVEEGTVTVRDRDSMQQERLPMENVPGYLIDQINNWETS